MDLDYDCDGCEDCYWCIFDRCTLNLKRFPAAICSEFSDSERFDFIDI